ncbi:hypothetical protein LPJ55_001797 [Coemansia sp. RSA 990]|nr:telomere stability and silencing-domain-containing protein [Coemansia mojavensis]KAJ1743416.1 hypothetical protein LPJ68_001018 [Coemansia sp. RSA 1086]KAJ1874094.1 hypothetical protein LPJ55_001797 [Coemansia sp. RSA 990]KAJ2648396.1 hypothetical protein IWW40_003931 [Coemansia sp. RSA 1250]
MHVILSIPGHKALSFSVCDAQPLPDLLKQAESQLGNTVNWNSSYITGRYGLSASEAILTSETPWLAVQRRVLGGKGGFGSTLRSQGSRMSNKPNSFDDCRDLYGRRLRTLKEAQSITDKLKEEEKAKEEAAERRRKKIAEGLQDRPAKKHRFDDTEYLKACDEIVESTKRTTKKALRKKLGKAASAESDKSKPPQPGSSSSTTGTESANEAPLVPLFEGELTDSSTDQD